MVVTLIRTFVAIDINSKDVVLKLIELQKRLVATGATMKLVEPENIHLTLYFLGEIPEEKIGLVKEIVESCCKGTGSFEIYLAGVGAFPKFSSPRVVWVGMKYGQEILSQIANCLRKNLPRHGFRKEEKEFSPHITLARVKKYNSKLVNEIKNLSNVEIGSLLINSVKIKKSTLTSRGPIYEDLHVIELK